MEAEKKVKTRLIIEAIAKQEGFEATEEEVQEEFKKMSVQYGVTPEKMAEIVGEDVKYIRKEICAKKAVDMLTENAVIEEVDPEEIDDTPKFPAE